tara:strand:- start:12 stop:278 length:267 start_codon:yes stop_codon:yes gene_type:complete
MLQKFHQELNESGSVHFTVRAVPNAAESKILEVMDDESIKIAVNAQSEKGKANKELIKFIANQFGVEKSKVSILSGESARIKIVKVSS